MAAKPGSVRSRRAVPVPNIQDILKKGQTLPVQVTKEPISTKGCRVTAQISLPGRFLVYMPYASKVGVSRKIESREQRAKLREMVTKLLPKDSGGVIVRTVAEGVTEEHFEREIESLLALWRKINRKKTFVRRAPALLQRETSLTRGIIRDLFSAKVDALHVDSHELYNEIEQYLSQIDPELIGRVHMYTEATPLFDKFDIESEIRDLFKARVELPTGGSLIIQPTEALISIDVNTGRYTGKKDPEKTILRTNIEAAREIARQIRLRDIGGIIVCDFIDMETRSNRDKVLQELPHSPRPRPGPHEGARRVRARPGGDDPAAGAAIPLALDDRRLPYLRGERAGVHAGGRGTAAGAGAQARGARAPGAAAHRSPPSGSGAVSARGGAQAAADALQADRP